VVVDVKQALAHAARGWDIGMAPFTREATSLTLIIDSFGLMASTGLNNKLRPINYNMEHAAPIVDEWDTALFTNLYLRLSSSQNSQCATSVNGGIQYLGGNPCITHFNP
jgi:hypothetical protein